MDPITLAIARTVVYGACLGCVTYTSLVLIRALRMERNIVRLLALGVLNCAQIVLVVEILSLLEAIRLRNLVLAHGSVALILAAFKCRPENLLPHNPREFFRNIQNRTDGPLRVLLAFTVLAGAMTFLLALYVPPNNHDSMTYHLARVGYYLQQGSLKSYPAANIRQTVFPANAEILMLWQVALLKNDRTVALVQWLSWLGSILAVYGIARQLRAPPKGALFAALAFASFPEIVLQSSSTQNDLVTAFFLLCAFVFVGELRSAPAAGSLLAGASLGLAIGTKTLAVVMLPGFGLYILACLFFQRGFTLRKVLVLTLLCLIGCLALGSYFYFQNLTIHGRATGPASITEMHSLDGFEWNVAWSNFGRSLMQFLNPNGIIPPWEPIRQAMNRGYLAAADSIFQHIGVSKHLPGIDFFDESWSDYQVLPMHEDWAMFGPIFGWLGLATLCYQLLRPGHLRESVRLRALALAPIVFWIIVSATLRWQLWLGRLMIPMVAISSPLLASLYLERKRRVSSIWNVLLVGACVSCLLSAVLLNEMKPLLGPWTIWGKDRIQILTRNRPSSETAVRFIDRLGLNDARIGFVPFNADSFEYPLFGKHFERKLIPIRIDRDELLSLRTLPEVNYLLLEAETQEFFPLPQSNAIREKRFGIIGLHPLIDSLRDPKSGWHPVLDVDGFLHLFARREEGLDSSAFYILPEFLPGQWNKWPDHWVKEDFVLHARIDPAKPTLEIGGETPALGVKPMIKIEGPDHKPLRTILLSKSGPFNSSVSLASLCSDYKGRYAALRFTSNLQFNPKKLGLSGDPRDLSWRLLELKFSSGKPLRSETPDYRLSSTWWPDKWVGDHFKISVRIDSATPVLQVSGEMPASPIRPELRVTASGQLLASFQFDQPGGLFTRRISLSPLLYKYYGKYVLLEFTSNYSFSPQKLKISSDYRDLSWRLYELELVPH